MEKQRIAPKTLVTVIAAQIKEDAEIIAKKIVEQAKGNDIDYQLLIENLILGKEKEKKITMSQFANNVFNEVKGIEKFMSLSVSIIYNYGFDRKDAGPLLKSNDFSIKMDIDEKNKKDSYWNISARGDDENAYKAYEEFKSNVAKNILNRNMNITEVVIEATQKK